MAYIPSLVTEEDNNMLLSTPSDQEIQHATFSNGRAEQIPGDDVVFFAVLFEENILLFSFPCLEKGYIHLCSFELREGFL